MTNKRNIFKGLLSVALLFLTIATGSFGTAGVVYGQTNAPQVLVKTGTITTNGGDVTIGPLAGQTVVTAQITGTFSATFVPKISNDNITFYQPSTGLYNIVSAASAASSTSGGFFSVQSFGARYVRITTTSQSSGTVVVQLVAGYTASSGVSTGGGTSDATAANQVTGNNYLASIDGKLAATTDSCDGVAASSKYYISVGTTEDENEIKATSGTLCGISARNAHASTNAFLKCTNLTAANTTPGTSAVFYEMMVPFGGGYVDNKIDVDFSTALTCYIVTGKAASDATEVAANDVSYFIRYR